MIELKEWLEFKLATADNITVGNVQGWLEMFKEFDEDVLNEFIAFKQWKNESDTTYNPDIDKYAEIEDKPIDKIPSSPAYKVGDKVEVVGNTTFGNKHFFNIGDIVTVVGIGCGGEASIKCEDENDYWWVRPEDIKPYTDLIQQQKEWLGGLDYGEIVDNSVYKVGEKIKLQCGNKVVLKAITNTERDPTFRYWFNDPSTNNKIYVMYNQIY